MIVRLNDREIGKFNRSINHSLNHSTLLSSLRMLQLEPNSILRVLRALRGEFSSTSGLASQPASVPCKPKSEVTTHSKRQGTSYLSVLLPGQRSWRKSMAMSCVRRPTAINRKGPFRYAMRKRSFHRRERGARREEEQG